MLINTYTSRFLLIKLGDIVKVEVSNISISITEDGLKSVSIYNVLRVTLSITYIKILEITRIGGT